MDKTIKLLPRLSEKAYAQSQARNVYVFDVPKDANKHTVARAVAAQFDVTVEGVNILNVQGKAKRTVRRSGRAVKGRQNDFRKAYVSVTAGQTIPVFAALEEASDAPADKPTAKETK